MEKVYLTEVELDATFIDNTYRTTESGMWLGICNDTNCGIVIYSFHTAKGAYEWIKGDMYDSGCTETDEDSNERYFVRNICNNVWGSDDKGIEWEIRFIKNPI